MLKKIIAGVLSSTVCIGMANANMQTTAKQGYIYDMATGTVLLNKNADARMYPASMTKMMTVYLVFEHLKRGLLSMNDTFLISKKAWKKGGSKMFVRVNTRVTVSDLLRGVIVQSGNDAAIALAEGLAGTEVTFAESITSEAVKVGMVGTNFVNATGWPHENHYTTSKDLATLAQKMIAEFPEYYPMWAEKSFTYDKIKQPNRNPLLYKNIGADGLKTGHTKVAGYSLTSSFVVGSRRLVMVLNGMNSKSERSFESLRLAKSAIYDYKLVTLAQAGMVLGKVPVAMIKDVQVPMVVQNTVRRTVKSSLLRNVKTHIEYKTPLITPIVKGDVIGTATITIPGEGDINLSLHAGTSVDKSGFFSKIVNNFNYILWGEM